MTVHHGEIGISESMVRSLVDQAFPQYTNRSLQQLRAPGSSNSLFRLGDDLLVRLPRQPGGSQAIAKEARWVRHISPAVPVPVPDVLAVGEPGFGYPESWSIVAWIDGDVPAVPAQPGWSTADLARDLAGVLHAMSGIPVPAGALADAALVSYRAEPLAGMDETTRHNLVQCRTLRGLDLDLDACKRVWADAMNLPDVTGVVSPRWLHGDLLAENLLVHNGRLAAVLDFGGLAVGDPTVDLVVAWELLDPTAREIFRSTLQVSESTWLRGRAWALAIALMTFPYYWQTMPERCTNRLVMARSVLADASSAS